MKIKGYASFFNVIDSVNDIVAVGAFTKTLKLMKKYNHTLPLLEEHDFTNIIGRIDKIKQNTKGLWIEATLFDKEKGKKIKKYIDNGIIVGFSICYNTITATRFNKKHKTYDTISNNTIPRILKEIHLVEISIVARPANSHCLVKF